MSIKPTDLELENIKLAKNFFNIARVDLCNSIIKTLPPLFDLKKENLEQTLNHVSNYILLFEKKVLLSFHTIEIIFNKKDAQEKTAQEKPIHISVQYIVTFLIKEGVAKESLSDEVIKPFSNFNGFHIVHPYLRAYVDDISRKIGLPFPIMLSLLNIT